ncbi:MAG: hypothetical protein IPK60_11465 [Sandaracinaceae bacterium]|nr:hypothetical protein [Sandaracinaceae bacterium]
MLSATVSGSTLEIRTTYLSPSAAPSSERFDLSRASTMSIESGQLLDDYRLDVFDSRGEPVFRWNFHAREQAEAFGNAVCALSNLCDL